MGHHPPVAEASTTTAGVPSIGTLLLIVGIIIAVVIAFYWYKLKK